MVGRGHSRMGALLCLEVDIDTFLMSPVLTSIFLQHENFLELAATLQKKLLFQVFYYCHNFFLKIPAAHSCSDVYLSVLSLNITDDSCHILCLHSNARLVPLRGAVKGPNKDRF